MGEDARSLQELLGSRYDLQGEVGSGGMATVLRARDRKHERDVAIKVLHPDVATAVGLERFHREIAIAAGLQHPNIVPLFDSGGDASTMFYIMPFIEGESLRQLLTREGQLPLSQAVAIARDVGEGLAHAHAHGIIHRDVKPANILMRDGRAMVADFGIARVIGGSEAVTSVGLVVGTPAYMSPEQASGNVTLDARTDVYSLACVMYEMVAGEPPFTGPTPQAVLARHMGEQPPSLRVVRPAVAGPLESAVRQGLAKVPADRFPTATAFVDALRSALEPHAAERRPPRFARKRLVVAAVATLAAAALLPLWARETPTDANTLAVFPFDTPGSDPAVGEQVALLIGSTLEHTEPLRWLAGTGLPGTSAGGDGALARAARRAGARYYVAGAIVPDADSVVVIVRLHDAAADSLVRQESARGAAGVGAPQLALRAVGRLLRHLLPPSGRVDLSYLEDRHPAAIADWLQGEQDYARSSFIPALEHMQRAIARDTAMSVAALKGAQAAAHLEDYTTASTLLAIARRHAAQLPRHHAALLTGLEFYVAGAADSAISAFTLARAADSTWSEPPMWLAETYYHLLPTVGDLDSLAERAFLAAIRLNPTFAPALWHLTERAVHRGNVADARAYLRRFVRVSPDSNWTFQVELMVRCVAEGAAAIDWAGAVRRTSERVNNVARVLGSGARHPECAREAARAVLAYDTVSGPAHRIFRWTALKELTWLTVASGDDARVLPLLDSARRFGEPAAVSLHVLNAALGVDGAAPPADTAMSSLLNVPVDRMTTTRLRYTSLWAWHRSDAVRLDSVARRAAVVADSTGNPSDRLVQQAAAARLSLVRGDTAAAIIALQGLRPQAMVGPLTWDLWESAAPERWLLAELQFRSGDVTGAARTAAGFDSPRTQIHLLYLRQSLRLRQRIAERQGDNAGQERLLQRLRALDALARR